MKYRRKDVAKLISKLQDALSYLVNDTENDMPLTIAAARDALEEFETAAATETVHHSSSYQDWMTPPWLAERIKQCFAPNALDLDPCANATNNMGAAKYFTVTDDGLSQPWGLDQTIYVNPPYNELRKPGWVDKIIEAGTMQNQMIVLTPARTDTRWYRRLFTAASHVTLLSGRLRFLSPDADGVPRESDPAPFPSALFGFGLLDWEPIRSLGITTTGGYWRTP